MAGNRFFSGILPQTEHMNQTILQTPGHAKYEFTGMNSSNSQRDHAKFSNTNQNPVSKLPPQHHEIQATDNSSANSHGITSLPDRVEQLSIKSPSSAVTQKLITSSSTYSSNQQKNIASGCSTLQSNYSPVHVTSIQHQIHHNIQESNNEQCNLVEFPKNTSSHNIDPTYKLNNVNSLQTNVNTDHFAAFHQVPQNHSATSSPYHQSNLSDKASEASQNQFILNYSQAEISDTEVNTLEKQLAAQRARISAKQIILPNCPSRLSRNTSQPKAYPSSPQQRSNINQILANENLITQENYTSTPNVSLSMPANVSPANHQVPPTLPQRYDGNLPPSQQKHNLLSNRYPSPNHLLQQKELLMQNQNMPLQQVQYMQQHMPHNTPQQTNIYQQPLTFQQPNYPNYQPTVASMGFNKLWGNENYDLLQNPNILPPTKIQVPRVNLGQEALDNANCSSDIFRCTMTKIPETNTLLQKSRLPLGILIHPFKDLSHLPVIQCNVIVRCRACRTYINPFVYFVDNKRWKCNLCYRINELPEEFQYDPVSKTYGDPSRRPEVRSSTIEYIAPAEYMLRPPQPAVYLFLLDVSRSAIETGYLYTVCTVLLEELKNFPGDARTQIGFLAYDSYLHFFSLAEGLSQPHEMTVLEIDDVFLPCPDNLLVNLKDRMEMVTDLLNQLATRYNKSFDNNSALGPALQVAHKIMSPTGGRVTVFQSVLPNVGPGSLASREIPSQRSSVNVALINPANDFYKRLSLECSAQQIAVDLFILNSQFIDIATISGISRFSGGCIYHFPLFKFSRSIQNEALERTLRRYLTRKIGFEAVMRIRCSRGLSIHTFHGNFFVRSTDLLSLPNINPDAGYGMQVAIDENLSDLQTVCFQAALLYTSSKGERRIRVHTLCLPVTSILHEIMYSADQQCIIGVLAKMAVDRSMQSSLSDAREAFINVAVDILSCYKMSLNLGDGQSGLLAPECLKLLPLYISALLKATAFRTAATRLDDRVKAMLDMKTKPLFQLMQQVYPDLYPIHDLEKQQVILNAEEEPVPLPPHLQLTARCLEHKGAFLMDLGEHMILYVCGGVSETFLTHTLGVVNFNSISEDMCELPILENPHNKRLHLLINHLNEEKPFTATLQIIRDNSSNRLIFLENLIEDRQENSLSYHEFLQHLKAQVK